ncbi:hypothetical protein BJ944DRAFT_244749 [Cunninghamella echinulata]|nr:hypothetical protein BJ944DRAFT_244749 [Cunninghamella echinulata]
MVLKSTLLLSLAFVQLAFGSSITITNPKPKAVWEAGKVVEFKWKVAESNSTIIKAVDTTTTTTKPTPCKHKPLSIALAAGPANSLLIDRVIASKVNACKGSYKWKIPKQFDTTKKYVVEIGPSASDIAFAGYITITKPNQHPKPTPTGKHTPKKSPSPTKSKSSKSKPTTPSTTVKHEPSTVCVLVPNSNGHGSTVKCHPVINDKNDDKKKNKKSQPKKDKKNHEKKQPKKDDKKDHLKPTPTITQEVTIATPDIV